MELAIAYHEFTGPGGIGWNLVDHDSKLFFYLHIDGLIEKRRNSSVLAMQLHLFSIKPSI